VRRAFTGALTIALLASCASSAPPVEEEIPSAEGYYTRAMEKLDGQRVLLFFSDVDYPGAIELFQEVIDNYPYSEYAIRAELAIADVHYEQGNYEEAASFYQDFVELHPSHQQAAYAIFRNGMCAYHRMHSPDQDPRPTEEAIAQFQVLLDRYPTSEFAQDARARLQEAENHLAKAIVSIGDFYFDRGRDYAAIRRYREALTNYPGHDGRLRTMARLATALKRMRRYYEAEQLFLQVIAAQPDDDDLLDLVQDELADLEQGFDDGGRVVRPLPRSCVTDPNPACGNGSGSRDF
jgi:outer membrane protein assembly factor BamD